MQRYWRLLLLTGLALVVAWPALKSPPTDGFPLSTYPMFASNRGPESVIATAVGRTESGKRIRLSPTILAGTDEPLIAIATARRAVQSQMAAASWCEEIARRVSRPGIISIEVVTETHDAVDYFARSAPALGIDVHVSCLVSSP